MKLSFTFTEDDFVDLCAKYVSREKTTIFQDLYDAIKYFVSPKHCVELNLLEIKHSYTTEYYDAQLSLHDYALKGFLSFPYPRIDISLPKDYTDSIESVLLPSFLDLANVDYGYGVFKSIKIKEQKLETKNKASIEFLNIKIYNDIISKIINRAQTTKEILLPSKLGVWEWRQTFYSKITGEVYFCKCFEPALIRNEFNENNNNNHDHLNTAIKYKSFKNNICHLCTKTNSDLFYCAPMYGSAFKVKYGAYIKKIGIEADLVEREAENSIRQEKGVAKIGEKWINETLLFNYIDILFPQYVVKREASPSWLGKQRLDIYIEELGLAIEYHGEQHFKPVTLFGGEEGLKAAKERDIEKLKKCKANNVSFVCFTYKDSLSEKLISSRLSSYIENKT